MTEPALAPLAALDHALAAAVSTIAPSVVSVARGHADHQRGTGLAWAADLVVTSSFHTPDRTVVSFEDDRHDAEVIGRDPGTDVALLRVPGAALPAPRLRELDGLAVGNLALAVGRPGRSARASLRAIGVLGPQVKTPWGGSLDRYVESDRQIPRGFAGGPLIDADGAVIGMNTRTLIRGSDLAVPVATLRRVVAELQAHGGIRRGYLGVGALPATAAGTRGALVTSIEDGGPAATAGILVGDVVVELDAVAIDGPDSLRDALADRGDRTVKATLIRGGARLELELVIGSKV